MLALLFCVDVTRAALLHVCCRPHYRYAMDDIVVVGSHYFPILATKT
jgi:hypothetical protein